MKAWTLHFLKLAWARGADEHGAYVLACGRLGWVGRREVKAAAGMRQCNRNVAGGGWRDYADTARGPEGAGRGRNTETRRELACWRGASVI